MIIVKVTFQNGTFQVITFNSERSLAQFQRAYADLGISVQEVLR